VRICGREAALQSGIEGTAIRLYFVDSAANPFEEHVHQCLFNDAAPNLIDSERLKSVQAPTVRTRSQSEEVLYGQSKCFDSVSIVFR